ncbi:MAG: MBL fold metallo-hydrolase [Muribaculaceae bacterium]|nr:MBL fold metallo-hydrolase [Muribaculaceae bacterium]
MKVSRFVFNPFGENTYIIWCQNSFEAAIIDPGMYNDKEIKAIDDFLIENKLTLTHLLLTHLHIDHVLGVNHIMSHYGLKPECSVEENALGDRLVEQSQMFGLNININAIRIEKILNDGDKIKIGDDELVVIKVAGHSPGGLAYYSSTSSVLFPGDIIFAHSIGRADLPGGNYNSLVDGIKNKILILPDETLVCPGHGDTTTIIYERDSNPFLC